MWETNGERVYVEISATNWNSSSLLHVRAGGITRSVRGLADATGGSKAVFELPRGLQPGAYPVQVSADGGMTFVPADPTTSGLVLTVSGCPAGESCTSTVKTPCPAGMFCPQAGVLGPLKCPLGSYAPGTNSSACAPCPEGMHCPELGMPEARHCPAGFVCNSSLSHLSRTGALSQLEPCPAGFYCNLNQAPRLCPHGHWCPEGTATPISYAGNFSSPQPCRDGIRCEPATVTSVQAAADPAITHDMTGARDPNGVADCAAGSYCRTGRAISCPAGAYCAAQGLVESRPCAAGTFRNKSGASTCELCRPGTFCYYHGQSEPYQCSPGYTCHYSGTPTPPQPCPAGSYCRVAVAANFSASTMQPKRRPRLCKTATYCLWGVSTPIVNSSDVRAA